jgi:hypothetical protein
MTGLVKMVLPVGYVHLIEWVGSGFEPVSTGCPPEGEKARSGRCSDRPGQKPMTATSSVKIPVLFL